MSLMGYLGTAVESVKATAYKQGKFVDVTAEDIRGHWSVVFFYPADFTFVCPTELGDLQENLAEFTKLGVEVYGVSTDTHFTHKAWHDTSETIKTIEYALIGDPNQQISRAFGVLDETTGLANRGTFVLDPEGQVQIVEMNADGIGRDAKELLRKIKAAIYVRENPGQACPAKWTEGAATLTPSLDLVGKI
jgi:peroxiredoxin (alkyl hydroperoxide reductase subunit C)